jgi:lipoyl(octanoyl) transferase
VRLEVRRLGLVEFEAAWAVQRELASARREALLLLEHPPVFTLGKHGDASNVLDARGIPVLRIDRGGDVTYHGPGQLVAYPVLDLKAARVGVHEHVRRIERAVIGALAELGIEAGSKADCVGVWTARGKIASLGIRVASGMSMHGVAINLSNDLGPFDLINPCGVARCAMTSASLELGRRVEVERMVEPFARCFAGAWNRTYKI